MPANETPIAGLHSVLHRMNAADTAPTAATAIGELTAIGDVDISRETAKFHTYQDSWERAVATTLAAGEVECEAVFIGNDEHQIALEAALISGAQAFYAVTYSASSENYSTGHIMRFEALVSNYARMAPLDDKVAVKFNLTITGEVTSAAL